MILAPISVGELIDKITILEIKMLMIKNPEKLLNVTKELTALNQIYLENLNKSYELIKLKNSLYQVNQELWYIEDYKRACEQTQNFDLVFIEAARNVYLKNDLRASIKREINSLTGSIIVEVKSY